MVRELHPSRRAEPSMHSHGYGCGHISSMARSRRDVREREARGERGVGSQYGFAAIRLWTRAFRRWIAWPGLGEGRDLAQSTLQTLQSGISNGCCAEFPCGLPENSDLQPKSPTSRVALAVLPFSVIFKRFQAVSSGFKGISSCASGRASLCASAAPRRASDALRRKGRLVHSS